MKIIIGLGNPGKQYEKTRHNAGFMALDFLREKLGASDFKFNKKFNAEISEAKEGRKKIIFAKPQTFMNNSGKAVQKILSFYKAGPEYLTVIHDDIDIELGEIRKQKNRSAAGHNGVQSIIDEIGTKEFSRIRIGVGRDEKIPRDAYVLQKFSPAETKKLKKAIEEISASFFVVPQNL